MSAATSPGTVGPGEDGLVAGASVAGPAVLRGGCRVLAGATSWSGRPPAQRGNFYPPRSLSAAARLAYYASKLPLVEVATTFRFPPSAELTRRWAGAVPSGFTFDLRAWSLLSGAPTWPESLWPDLQHYVRPSRREGAKLYRHRLPAEALDECWARFRHALSPLAEAHVLGCVIFRYPSWFSPRPAAWEELAKLPERMPGFSLAVELGSERWFQGDGCEKTLSFLEELGAALVCRAPTGPARPNCVVAATSGLSIVRFVPSYWPAPRCGLDELVAWSPVVEELASCSSEVHLLVDDCPGADAAADALGLLATLAGGGAETSGGAPGGSGAGEGRGPLGQAGW